MAVCYSPPEADSDYAQIFDFVSWVRRAGYPLLLTGDINIPEIAWSLRSGPKLVKRSQTVFLSLGYYTCGVVERKVNGRAHATLQFVRALT